MAMKMELDIPANVNDKAEDDPTIDKELIAMEVIEDHSYFDILPNEALLKVLKYLDAVSLIQATKVCHRWKELMLEVETVLWKKLCRLSGRISGEYTADAIQFYANKYGWKKTYFWITNEDLKQFATPNELVETVNNIDRDAYKKRYFLAKGI